MEAVVELRRIRMRLTSLPTPLRRGRWISRLLTLLKMGMQVSTSLKLIIMGQPKKVTQLKEAPKELKNRGAKRRGDNSAIGPTPKRIK